jgi:hypothetical protein
MGSHRPAESASRARGGDVAGQAAGCVGRGWDDDGHGGAAQRRRHPPDSAGDVRWNGPEVEVPANQPTAFETRICMLTATEVTTRRDVTLVASADTIFPQGWEREHDGVSA